MKLSKYRKYQTPRVSFAHLEAEGVLCGSLVIDAQLDMLENVNARTSASEEDVEGLYLEF